MDVKNLNIAYIGGGARERAWGFMTDLALEPQLSGNVRLYASDTEVAADNAVIGNSLSQRGNAAGKWRYTVCTSIEEALTGANFVIISAQPGTFAEMRCDVHLPERIGVYQSVGDTTGPGGIIRALRTIPVFAHIAEAVRDYAPEAWVINYTNPMALCIRALYHYFPKIKAFGCCREVFAAQELLAHILWSKEIVKDIRRNDIHINVLGLNHFTWFSKASVQGLNIKGIYKEFVREHYDLGFQTDQGALSDKIFSCYNRVKFDLFLKYGWIAAAGDRYLAEFINGEQYLKNPETVRKWGYHLIPVSWREDDFNRRVEQTARLVRGEEELPLKPSGEEGVLLIKALCGLRRVVSNVNLPNTSLQAENLPADTVVETNALFSYNDVRPVMAGAVEPNIMELMEPHIKNQETVLHAAVNCERAAVYEAFLRDPLLAGRACEKDITALADDMLKNTAAYLPDEWRKK